MEVKNIDEAVNYIYKVLNEKIKKTEYDFSIKFRNRLTDEEKIRKYLSIVNFDDTYINISFEELSLILNRNNEFKENLNTFLQEVFIKIHQKRETIELCIRIPLWYEN